MEGVIDGHTEYGIYSIILTLATAFFLVFSSLSFFLKYLSFFALLFFFSLLAGVCSLSLQLDLCYQCYIFYGRGGSLYF